MGTLEAGPSNRYMSLYVAPYVGGIKLQQLSAMDLNDLYRELLDSGRRFPNLPFAGTSQRPASLWLSCAPED